MNEFSGRLSIVSTPIGNLEDITLRALRILKEADMIACEDTRHSLKLLQHYGISKHLMSYHQFNEARRTLEFVEGMKSGQKIALISDAGTPGISDPGWRVISSAIREGITVEVIPGPSALISALVGSGLATDAFYFGGFLPIKSAQRQNLFRKLTDRPETLCFYESPHRIERALEDLEAVWPGRKMVLARELTKIHEEFVRGTPTEVRTHFSGRSIKGEIVLMVDGNSEK